MSLVLRAFYMNAATVFSLLLMMTTAVQAAEYQRDADLDLTSAAAYLPGNDFNSIYTRALVRDHTRRGPGAELFRILASTAPRDHDATAEERFHLKIGDAGYVFASRSLDSSHSPKFAIINLPAGEVSLSLLRENQSILIHNDELVRTFIAAMTKLGYPVEKGPRWQRGVTVTGKFIICSDATFSMSSVPYCKVKLDSSPEPQ